MIFFLILLSVCEVVLLYLPIKVDDVGLNRKEAALLMSIYGAVFAVSQIVVGILADLIHIPTTYILMFSTLAMSLISVAITFCYSFSLFALAASLFAICTGQYLQASIITSFLSQEMQPFLASFSCQSFISAYDV